MTTVLNKPSESLHARIPQDILKDIDNIASNIGRSRNWVFNEALKQYLEVQQWQTAVIEHCLTESENSKATFINHNEIMEKHEKRLKAKIKL
jgi:predicted transcriptional regulator